ncbi:MAG: outer membrane beta-barrel protein, partial [Thermoanaerobaculia bacterium]|nr:outer membrane beta-barrel protein [Thermoanaerobaculia bacterium]
AQYRTPGTGVTISENRRTQLETAIEEARWNLGPVRVQPWIGFRDIVYQDNIPTADGPVDDIHGSAGAGLKFYLPVGEDVVIAAHALPEYNFWIDLDDRNQVIGRYGLGVFAFLNRLELEVTGRRIEDVTFVSGEVLRQLPQTQDTFDAKAQLRITGSLALAVSGNVSTLDYEEYKDSTQTIVADDPGIFLDREETKLRAGVRYLLRSEAGFFGIGVQDEDTTFDLSPERDNQGTSIYIEALLQGNKLDIAFDIAQRDLEASSPNGSFPGFDDTTGGLLIAFHPRSTSELQFYTRRDLSYSALNSSSYYTAYTYGVAAELDLSRRSDLRAFYEIGENDYFGGLGGFNEDEDVNAWGATMSTRLGRLLNLRLGYRLTEYDSVALDRDREVEEILFGLSIGSGPGDW